MINSKSFLYPAFTRIRLYEWTDGKCLIKGNESGTSAESVLSLIDHRGLQISKNKYLKINCVTHKLFDCESYIISEHCLLKMPKLPFYLQIHIFTRYLRTQTVSHNNRHTDSNNINMVKEYWTTVSTSATSTLNVEAFLLLLMLRITFGGVT